MKGYSEIWIYPFPKVICEICSKKRGREIWVVNYHKHWGLCKFSAVPKVVGETK